MPKKVDFGTERVDLGFVGLISSLKEPDLGLWRDIWIDRWTDRQKYRCTDRKTDGQTDKQMEGNSPLCPVSSRAATPPLKKKKNSKSV